MGKNPPANSGDAGNVGSIPGSGRFPGGGHGNPLQCSCLENSMDRGARGLQSTGLQKSWTRLKRLSMHARTELRFHMPSGTAKRSTTTTTTIINLKNHKHIFVITDLGSVVAVVGRVNGYPINAQCMLYVYTACLGGLKLLNQAVTMAS